MRFWRVIAATHSPRALPRVTACGSEPTATRCSKPATVAVALSCSSPY